MFTCNLQDVCSGYRDGAVATVIQGAIMTIAGVHRRWNPLKKEYVLVSPHRLQRPWQGQMEDGSVAEEIQYDPNCFLCPGNTRASEDINDDYTTTFTFKNDFSALLPAEQDDAQKKDEKMQKSELFKSQACSGECHVICFSPNHNKTMGKMSAEEVLNVVVQWTTSFKEKCELYKHCQIFENKGAVMGCSNPHPHGQMWCSDYYPSMVETEIEAQAEYQNKNGKLMLIDYVQQELEKKERVIYSNTWFVVLTPFWSCWPYELLILPRVQMQTLIDFTHEQQKDMADVLKRTTMIYDRLFNITFPYSMGLHQVREEGFTFHIHFYPPLLNGTRKKFIAGFELLAECQRDSLVETVAIELRKINSTF